jgi:hypothetical protein
LGETAPPVLIENETELAPARTPEPTTIKRWVEFTREHEVAIEVKYPVHETLMSSFVVMKLLPITEMVLLR